MEVLAEELLQTSHLNVQHLPLSVDAKDVPKQVRAMRGKAQKKALKEQQRYATQVLLAQARPQLHVFL